MADMAPSRSLEISESPLQRIIRTTSQQSVALSPTGPRVASLALGKPSPSPSISSLASSATHNLSSTCTDCDVSIHPALLDHPHTYSERNLGRVEVKLLHTETGLVPEYLHNTFNSVSAFPYKNSLNCSRLPPLKTHVPTRPVPCVVKPCEPELQLTSSVTLADLSPPPSPASDKKAIMHAVRPIATPHPRVVCNAYKPPYLPRHTQSQEVYADAAGALRHIDACGRVVCSVPLARTLLVCFCLFPPLWLLMGLGYLDHPVGVIPRPEKFVALTCSTAFMLLALAGVVVGLVY